MMRRLSAIISIFTACVIIPILCAVEYSTRIKLGMYRYVFMKNYWLTRNIFTPEVLPYVCVISSLVVLAAIFRSLRANAKRIWLIYGVCLLAGGIFLFNADNFLGLRSGSWLALALLMAELTFGLRSFLA